MRRGVAAVVAGTLMVSGCSLSGNTSPQPEPAPVTQAEFSLSESPSKDMLAAIPDEYRIRATILLAAMQDAAKAWKVDTGTAIVSWEPETELCPPYGILGVCPISRTNVILNVDRFSQYVEAPKDDAGVTKVAASAILAAWFSAPHMLDRNSTLAVGACSAGYGLKAAAVGDVIDREAVSDAAIAAFDNGVMEYVMDGLKADNSAQCLHV